MNNVILAGVAALSLGSAALSQNSDGTQQIMESVGASMEAHGGTSEGVGDVQIFRSEQGATSAVSIEEIEALGVYEAESPDEFWKNQNFDVEASKIYSSIDAEGTQSFYRLAPDGQSYIFFPFGCQIVPWACALPPTALGESWTPVSPEELPKLENGLAAAVSAETYGMLFQMDGSVTVLREFSGATYSADLWQLQGGEGAQISMELLPSTD